MTDNPILFAFASELTLRARLREIASARRVESKFVRSLDELRAALDGSTPILVVLDLHYPPVVPEDVMACVRSRPSPVPVWGLFSHVAVDIGESATAAGVDVVLPRSKFFQAVETFLRQHVAGMS